MHADRLPASLREIDKLFKALKARDAEGAAAAARLHVANAEKEQCGCLMKRQKAKNKGYRLEGADGRQLPNGKSRAT